MPHSLDRFASYHAAMDAGRFRELAHECGFELAGVAAAEPVSDAEIYLDWTGRGLAGEMQYLTDRRAQVRCDPRNLLASARSVLCVGKLYNTAGPRTQERPEGAGWISRYAWGGDYHDWMRGALKRLAGMLEAECGAFEHKICVDTAPLLERSYARRAGLGWIGKNTCLINQRQGSWFFLGEILAAIEITPCSPPPDRCGSCRRCIDACPTAAIVPAGDGRYELDATRCISYFTIELRADVPEDRRAEMGGHVFGCDICQEVCPWNRRAPATEEACFAPAHATPDLASAAAMSEEEFRGAYAGTPVARAKYSGFLRNVAIAMGNSGRSEMIEPLRRLADSADAMVAEHARWALKQIEREP